MKSSSSHNMYIYIKSKAVKSAKHFGQISYWQIKEIA